MRADFNMCKWHLPLFAVLVSELDIDVMVGSGVGTVSVRVYVIHRKLHSGAQNVSSGKN